MTIFQGEIYWIDLGEPQGSEPAYCVCINNQFETSKSYW
jgi:mRNA interferase MazF